MGQESNHGELTPQQKANEAKEVPLVKEGAALDPLKDSAKLAKIAAQIAAIENLPKSGHTMPDGPGKDRMLSMKSTIEDHFIKDAAKQLGDDGTIKDPVKFGNDIRSLAQYEGITGGTNATQPSAAPSTPTTKQSRIGQDGPGGI